MLTQLDKNKKKMATDNFILCGCQSEFKKKKQLSFRKNFEVHYAFFCF